MELGLFPHFRGCYVQASMELGLFVLISEGVMYRSWDLMTREVSSFQRMLCTGFNGVSK